MNLDLRPMSTGQLLDRTFWLYRRNFLLFAGIAALPPALGFLGQAGMLAIPFLSNNSADSSAGSVIAAGTGGLIWLVLYLAGYALATGASVYAVSNAHLAKRITISEAYKAVGDRVFAITPDSDPGVRNNFRNDHGSWDPGCCRRHNPWLDWEPGTWDVVLAFLIDSWRELFLWYGSPCVFRLPFPPVCWKKWGL